MNNCWFSRLCFSTTWVKFDARWSAFGFQLYAVWLLYVISYYFGVCGRVCSNIPYCHEHYQSLVVIVIHWNGCLDFFVRATLTCDHLALGESATPPRHRDTPLLCQAPRAPDQFSVFSRCDVSWDKQKKSTTISLNGYNFWIMYLFLILPAPVCSMW